MGLFSNGNFFGATKLKIAKKIFLSTLVILSLFSYKELGNNKSNFFVSTIDSLIEQAKRQVFTKNNTFDFQSHNQKNNIRYNDNVMLVEDCFNEYDDDGDGLIDCYDDDCAGVGVCDSFIYQYTDLPNCQFVPPTTIGEFKIEETYQTDFLNYPIDQRSGVFVGDMDSDGIPDLVGKDPNPGRIQIFNGIDGSIKQSIVIPTNSPFSQPTIADVDRDGNGDIFVMVNSNQLRRYEYGNPAVVWQTGNQIGDVSTHSSAQVADLDQDGTPEVYVGNRIFNALTGTRLAIGTGSTGKAFDSATKNHDKYPIAFDVFAPGDPKPNGGTFGSEAQGLELIAGNQVYTYTPGDGTQDNGSLDVVASISGGDFKDGFTSISDIDGDNLVDIAVMASGKIYIWNPRTQSQIGSTFDIPGTNTGGRINIGDFDNDGMVEIGTAGRSIYVVLEYDAGANALVIKWQKTGLDDGSQRTGSTLFDFEGDGINEVVYSEEAHLYVWRGTDGSELVKIPAQAGTRTEYPVVADVNNDGAAEIIITAQNGNGPGFSGNDFISVYRSMNTPWVTARKVWNQHGYFVTNINDDLTVPREQQNPLDSDLNNAYNGFLVQTTILNANGGGATPAFAAADAIIEIDSITIENCPDLVVHSTITNQGSNDLPATTPIAFYDQDPSVNAATLLGTTTVGSVLSPAEETNISTTLMIAPLIAPITVYAVINDPGTVATPYSFSSFPISGVGECEFNNNIAQLTSPVCIEICKDGVDNDSDGITDEPNIRTTTTSGCSGMVLPTFTTDEAGGTWEVISSIGTTISNTGMVTLGTNDTSTPDIDTIVYIGGLCSDTVLVNTFDNENPQLVCPSDQSLTVDNNCMVNLPDYTGMASTGDNCSGVAEITLSQSPAIGSTITVGVTMVTITATDKSGNSMTCQFQVKVTDEIAPVITCPTDTTLYLNNACGIRIPDFTSFATVNDNCSVPANISVSQNPAIGTLLEEDEVTQLIILTARDENGNTSTCDFTITLQDTLAPIITCPTDITINADANCEGELADYTSQLVFTDNCAPNSAITITQTPAAGTQLTGDDDTEIITLRADDGNGNSATCTFNVMLEDNTPPVLTCPSNQSLLVNTACEITIPDYTSMVTKTDNCQTEAGIVLTQNPVEGTVINVLDTIVEITITGDDGNGNTTNCTFDLTLKDEIAPQITCPANVSISLDNDCKATLADYTSLATISDNCTPMGDLTITQSPAAGQIITTPGITMVTLTVTDENGNTNTCTFEVTFEDTTNPTLTCPADATISMDGDCAITLPDYTTTATYADNCSAPNDLAITQSPVAGTMLSGDGFSQVVTLTVTDESGNTVQCNFTVSLEDTTKPTIECPNNQSVYIDANCELLIADYTSDATVNSDCATSTITITQSPLPNTTLSGHGTTQTITLTATDNSGNSNQCSFIITLIDTIQPTITCPADSIIYADANCENTVPDLLSFLTYTDNCAAIGDMTSSQSPAAGTPVSGEDTNYTVTFTVKDGNGNENQCAMTVELKDTTAPIINCLADQTVFATAACQGSVPNYIPSLAITDNCTINNALTITQNPIAGTTLSGHNDSETITITATDNSGNSTQCTFEVILKDTISPSITCPADITLNADANCEASISDYTSLAVVMDNCTADAAITVTQSPAAGTKLTGHNEVEQVTLTANDGNGNSTSCTFNITLKDITPPTLTCPTDQSLLVDANCEITIPDYTSMVSKSDNCTATAAVSLTQNPAAGTIIGVLDTMVKITIIGNDGNGNIDSCDFELTLKDEIAPSITCPANVSIDLDGNCQAVLVDYTNAATVSDNCSLTGNLTVTQSPAIGTIINSPSINTVTLTVTNESGNSANCSFEVSFEDNTNPSITCPANATLSIDGDCPIALPDYTTAATFADNCSGNTALTVTQNPIAGTMLSGDGTSQNVTITVTDEAGNSNQCSFTVTLEDTTAPSITCPADQNVYATATCEVAIPDYTSNATISSTCATGNNITVTQNPLPNTVINGHNTTQTITLTATDAYNNSSQCTFVITVKDTLQPILTCPADSTIYTDAACENMIPNLLPALNYTDNCAAIGSLTVTQSPIAGTSISGDSTTYTVIFTVNDGNGNQSQCSMTVELIDTTAPVINCLTDQMLFADNTCQGIIPNYVAGITVTDDCAVGNELTISQNPIAGTVLSGHNNSETITITATDNSGNSTECTFEVVLKDTISPIITCPSDIVLTADANCQAAIADYTNQVVVSDNCTATNSLIISQSPVAGTVLSGHGDSETITLTVDDGNGNTSSCTFTVSLKDETPPSLTCPTNQTLAVNASCEITVPDYTGMVTKTDNCQTTANITLTQSPAAGTVIGVLDTVLKITIVGDDANGNIDSCSFNLTLKDEIAPSITCPANTTVTLDGNCQAAIADYTSQATIADNCTNTGALTVTQSPAPTTLISSPSTQTITLTVTDESGNTNQCTFEVTYEDNTMPSISCPTNKTLSVDGDCPIALPDYTTAATYADNCSGNAALTVTQNPIAGTMISGDGFSQNVTITVADEAGNTNQCSFTVTLEDTTAPTIVCPANQNVYATANCEVAIPDYTNAATIASTCATGNNITLTQNPPANTIITGHNTTQTITLTATDASNNASQCTFVITVVDTLQPIITCPSDSTVYADANCENTIPNLLTVLNYTDNCTAIGDIMTSQSPAAGTPIMGDSTEYTVTFTVDDGNGNQSQCSMTVELVDTTSPVINCLTDQMLFADNTCQGIVPNYVPTITVTDNCAVGNALIISQSPIAGTVLSGHNDSETITITATDNSGNSTQCTFEVSLKDTISPIITCPADIVLTADVNCQASIADYTNQVVVSDNCTATNSLTTTQSPVAGTTLSGHGDSETITLTVDDGNGNTSSCTFTVSLKDETPPNLTCPANQTLLVDANCEITVPDYTSMVTKTDNCQTTANITLSQNPAAGTVIGVLDTILKITITGDDANGNIDSCSFNLTLKDEIAPSITCPANTMVTLDGNCQAIVADYRSLATIGDNCTSTGALTITQSPAPTTLINSPSTQTITLTVTDESGNATQCTFDVTYEDNTIPSLICPANDTLGVDGVCAIPLPDYRGNASYADNCTDNDDLVVTQVPAVGTMISGDGFDQTVTITVIDASGNSVQCNFIVALRDLTIPSISCPGNQDVFVDNTCTILIPDYTNEVIVSTNCSNGSMISVTQSPVANTVLSGNGTTQTITLTATDGSGNMNQCSFEITVRDTVLPQIICPADSTIYADADCGNIIPNLLPVLNYTDNCTPTNSITATQSPVAGTVVEGDSTSYTVTFTVDDGNGNQSQCAMTVELVDTTSPVINCLTDQMLFADNTCQGIVPNYVSTIVITDNCAVGNELVISQNPVAGTILSGHNDSETITITATDDSGNSTQCTFDIVLKDTISPLITCPVDIVLTADANCQATISDYTNQVVVSDNCTATNALVVSQTPAVGTILSGHNDSEIITLTVDDGNGNTTSCTFIVSLKDETAPSLTCPANQTLAVNVSCEITVPDYTNMVTKTDNCQTTPNIVLTQNPAAGTVIGVLDTVLKITIIGDDANGNIDSCSFNLTLKDEIAPSITCPANTTVTLDENCQAVIADYTNLATIADNCTNTSELTITQNPAPTTLINTPTVQTITLTVTDESGNTSQCTFEVNYEDKTIPSITCPTNKVLSIDGNCPIALPDYTSEATFADNCSTDAGLTVTQNPIAGTMLSGNGFSQNVTIMVVDESGNPNQCSFTVTLEDTTAPTIICPSNQNVYATANCEVVIPDFTNAATISSICTTGNNITVIQNPPANTIITGHNTTQTITLTATDASNNSSQCTFIITVLDTLQPIITCPTDSTIYAEVNCENTIPNLLPVLNYTDNCTATGGVTTSQSPAAGTPISGDSTNYTITFTVDDGNGNQSQCSMTVELIDTTAPSIICPVNQTFFVDANCENTVPDYLSTLTVMDNCASGNDLTLTQNPVAGTTISGHNTNQIVVITATDNSGNSTQCAFNILLKDTLLPTIICPADLTINGDVDCEVTIDNYLSKVTVADNCTATNAIVLSQSPAAGTIITGHNTVETITIIADDGNGNKDSCTFNLTIEDVTPPTLSCPSNESIAVDANCEITIPDYTGMVTKMDNCQTTANIILTQNPVAGTVIGVLDTTVKITITGDDLNGNIDSCSFFVTLKDEILPQITCPTKDTIALDANCQGMIADYTSNATIADNCTDTGDLTITQSPVAGQLVNSVGAIDITLTVADGSGNQATCTFEIFFKDDSQPSIICPANDTLSIDGDCPIALPDYRNQANIADNCSAINDLIITQNPVAGTMLSGHNFNQTVTLTVTDQSGNTEQCTFIVNLKDATAPTITCPNNQNIYADANCEVLIPDYTSLGMTASNCATGNAITVTQNPAANTMLSGHGTVQTIILTATDASNNSSQCSFNITVLDTIQPTIVCPADSTIYANNNCENTIPNLLSLLSYQDNCTVTGNIIATQSPTPGTVVAGDSTNYTITFTVNDGNGNQSQCMMTVELVDTTAPVLTCITNQVEFADANCQGVVPDYLPSITVTDNCAIGNELTLSQSPTAGTTLSGHNDSETITITATDNSGNTTQCSFEVVLKDTLAPNITCPADIILYAATDCQKAIGDYTNLATVGDNCTATNAITITQNPAAGTILSGEGDAEIITLTANDGNGNSATCTFVISLKDTIPPTLSCPTNQVIAVDNNCEISIPDYSGMVTKSDNCLADANVVLTQRPAAGTIIGVLDTVIQITIIGDDTYGNIDSCHFELRLKDEIIPQITCPANIDVSLDADCQATLADYTSLATISDNCTTTTGLTITQSPAAGQIINGPTVTTVTLVITDESGNTNNCAFEVNYEDTTKPSLTCPADETISVDGDCPMFLADYTQTATYADNCTLNSNLTITQNPIAGTLLKENGTTQIVTITVTDESGNSTECSLIVSLEDKTPPALVCHNDEILYANGTCEIAIPDYTNPTITSACATGNDITVGQIPAAGTIISGHQTMQAITITAKDKSGNTSQCTFNVTVVDTINPQIICPADTTIYTDDNCENTIPDLLAVLNYEDNCTAIGNIITTQYPIVGTAISGDSTSYTVTFTVDDGNGNQSQCAMTVELVDTTAPEIICLADQVLYATTGCENTIPNYIPAIIRTDNCANANEFTITQTPTAGTILSGHNDSETIIITITDNSGNTSECDFEVVLKDTISPMITCPVDQIIIADAGCTITLADYTSIATVNDNCTVAGAITVSQSPVAGTVISGLNATQTITLVADDGNGNRDSCQLEVILKDETAPTYTCVVDQTIYLDAMCGATLPDFRDSISPTDNCSSTGALVLTQFPAPGTAISEHDTEIAITLQVTDESHNTQNCLFKVILKDTIAPMITCPVAKIRALDSNCDFTIPDYRSEIVMTDNCRATADIILTQNPAVGTVINGHNTEVTITFTADDGNGNTNTCDLLLTIKDSINPTLICPPDISLSVDENCERILADYRMATQISDNCADDSAITVTQKPVAGTILSDSRTVETITIYANDGNGNIDSCAFKIALTDTIPPSITCPEIQNIYMDEHCEMLMPDYTGMVSYTDNCLTSGVTITQQPAPGTLLSGTDTIIQTVVFATDFDNNVDSCVFHVVLKDTIKPIVDCLPNHDVYLDSTCFYTVANYTNQITITDNCTVPAGIEILQFPPAGVRFTGAGSIQTITLAVIDETGNETQCQFDITLKDTIAPILVCPDTQFIDVDGFCSIEIPDYTNAATRADNCSPDELITVTQFPTGINLSGNGTIQQVTLTALDESGNSSTCDFVVKLVDRTIPAITCPGDQDLQVDANCEATIPDYRDLTLITNDCDVIAGITLVQDPAPGTQMLSGIGTEQEIIITAMDNVGNENGCSFKVTLVDTIAPEITCLAIDSLYLDACFSEIPDYSSLVTVTDNCSAMEDIRISQSMEIGVLIIEEHAGVRLIQIYAEDGSGNVATCEFPIIFLDTFPPFIDCPTDTVAYMDEICELVMPDYTNFVLPLDNCADLAEVTVSQSPSPGTILHDSDTTYVVTLTADDSHGNQSVCTFNVTLIDTIPPVVTCPIDQLVAVNENCQTSIPDYNSLLTITDNCTESIDFTIIQTPAPGTILNGAGNDTTITFTVMDKEGNISTCSFNYNQTDQTAPLLTCPRDTVLSVDDDCQSLIPNFIGLATITDNCSATDKLVITQSPAAGTALGKHGEMTIITISATDEYGNKATCDFTLSYQDTIAPVVTCPENQTLLIDDNCEAILPDYTALATANNTCNSNYPLTFEQIPAAGTILSSIGTIQEVAIIAKDAQGNADTCKFKVTLIFNLPPLIVREDIKVGEPIQICIDHPCLTGSDIIAFDKSGLGVGMVAGGDFEVNIKTGCLTYRLPETPRVNKDSFDVVVCDANNFCDTINYCLRIANYQALIVDPCVCLNNESSFNAGDGQFFEYTRITAPSGDNWKVVTSTGFYVNPATGITQPNTGTPYPLNPITPGTAAIEVPKGNGLSDYYLAGLHIDGKGYSVSLSNSTDTLQVANTCTYDASCRNNVNPDEEGLPPEAPSCSIEIGNGKTPALTTLKDCEGCQFRSNNTEHLYQDTSSRNVIHTICAADKWKQLMITFSQFDLAVGDTLFVYDGKTIAAPLIGKYSGAGVSQTGGWVASSCLPSVNPDGCITFQFKTNGDNSKGKGWQSEATCVEKEILLTPPNNLVATLNCEDTYAVFDILSATITANCGIVQDSQIIRIFNAQGELCLDTCLATTDTIKADTFGIGVYSVAYKLKTDTAKTAQAVMNVQAANLVCNDEINVPLGTNCAITLTPDDLLENTCDTLVDTVYYFITLRGKDKNGQDSILASGGGKGGNYPEVTKDMIDQCGGRITAEIERRYYQDLNLTFCNNGVQSTTCQVKVNSIDQTPPVFQTTASSDTFKLCNVNLTAEALGIMAPMAIDNCDSAKVEFVGATVLNDGATCDTTRAVLNWSATDACGNEARLAQSVIIIRPDMTDIVQTSDVILSCGETGTNELVDGTKTGMPRIKVGKVVNGTLVPTDTIALDTTNYICGYILQKREVQVPASCGVKIFRYWDVLDWCDAGTGIVPVDTQLIELRDTMAPKFVITQLPRINLELPHDACVLDITKLTAPAATDNCSTPIVEIAKVARIENGERWPIPTTELITLMADSFEVTWVAADDCTIQTKTTSITQLVIIEDVTKPAAICGDNINLAIGQSEARLHYSDIDAGSNDACGIVKYEVSRDEINWDSVVIFDCEDVNQEQNVYLRVTDAAGNQNTCWTSVVIEDKLAPICSDLPDITQSCDEVHLEETLVDTDANGNGQMEDTEWIALTSVQGNDFNTKYGHPICTDNITCRDLVIEQQYQLLKQTCGEAHLKRRFRAIDGNGTGKKSNWSTQNIRIETKANWVITLPADWTGNCNAAIPTANLEIQNGACDLMAYEVEDQEFRTVEDACLKIVRTFTITNWCVYEAGQAAIKIAREEDEHGIVTTTKEITSTAFEKVGRLEYVQILKLATETSGEMARVSGTIMDWKENRVEAVQVTANTNSMATQADGAYTFDLPMYQNYTIQPAKDDQPLNGVSTFDLVLMTKHILGIQSFENPYQLIAADVNRSGTVTTFDLVQARRLILAIDEHFQNNTSWRFVESSYEFTTNNPLTEQFPEVMQLTDLRQDRIANFTAIKIGDVNGNARANSLMQGEDRTTEAIFEIETTDKMIKAGDLVKLEFKTHQLANIQGYQFTLGYEDLKVEKLHSGLAGIDNFGLQKMEEGFITTSWNQSAVDSKQLTVSSNPPFTVNREPSTVLFTIEFTALKDGQLSEQIRLINRPTVIEAYNENGALMDVQLTFTTPLYNDQFELFQNQPNPFPDKTEIGFYLPGDSDIQLVLRDEAGRVLRTIKENRKAGYHTIQLNEEELANGFIYYQLSTKFGTKAKKMLKLK